MVEPLKIDEGKRLLLLEFKEEFSKIKDYHIISKCKYLNIPKRLELDKKGINTTLLVYCLVKFIEKDRKITYNLHGLLGLIKII